MKRMICQLCGALLLLSLCGCQEEDSSGKHFYYLRSEDTIAYGNTDALIAPVEISAEGLDVQSLFQLYLQGPDSELYRSPLASNIRLLSVSTSGNALVLEFTSGFNAMSDVQITLSGACLCATAREVTGLESLTIRAGDLEYTFRYDSFLFLDGPEASE